MRTYPSQITSPFEQGDDAIHERVPASLVAASRTAMPGRARSIDAQPAELGKARCQPIPTTSDGAVDVIRSMCGRYKATGKIASPITPAAVVGKLI
jgi:hypothetical protein